MAGNQLQVDEGAVNTSKVWALLHDTRPALDQQPMSGNTLKQKQVQAGDTPLG